MHDPWEYLWEGFTLRENWEEKVKTAEFGKLLNERGEEGWELVSNQINPIFTEGIECCLTWKRWRIDVET